MGRIILFFYIIFQFALPAAAQQDTAGADTPAADQSNHRPLPVFRDSAAIARWKARQDSIQAVKDSLKAIGDSLSMVWLKPPDSNRPNRFLDSLVDLYRVKDLNFQAWAERFPAKTKHIHEGKLRPKGEPWIFWFIILLLLVFAVLRKAFSKEFLVIFHALFSSRTLNQVIREERLFSSWPFMLLYLLLSFIIGTFLYFCQSYFHFIDYDTSGFEGLAMLSLGVFIFFTFKIVSLRALAFIFDLRKAVSGYISVLYISFFNIAVLFLPLTIAISLTPFRFVEIYIYTALLITGLIFLTQFIRAGTVILSEYRFPIVYLLLYICALEICPLIILMKLIRF